MKAKTLKQNKVNIITLGCSKNLVDSEMLSGQLAANDIAVVHENKKLDHNIVVVNTCGFIDKAKEESVNTILDQVDLKKKGKLDKVYVTGCLSERYRGDLAAEIPEVDAWFGTMELPLMLNQLNADYKAELLGERLLSTPQHYAYLKISEGCNRTCSFCAIPLMRGQHVSKTIEQLVDEAKGLVKKGVKEVMLIAQELTYYGLDIYKERALPKLLNALADVEGLEWIRLHYAYPSQFPMDALDVMRERDNICKYIDIPLQHTSDNMLKIMRRGITSKRTQEVIDAMRDKVPGIAIRTTLIAGHPGETEKDFQDLCKFVEYNKFDRLGIFTYSHEEGTHAGTLVDDVPQEVKEERAAIVMDIQQGISAALNQQKVGKTFKVLFDRKDSGFYVGRTEFDSPEVDNEVLVDAKSAYVRIGDFANVKIDSAEDFDLYGTVVS